MKRFFSDNPHVLTLQDHKQRNILSLLAERNIDAVHELGRDHLGLASTAHDALHRIGPRTLLRHLSRRPDIRPNATDAHGRTALSYACQCGFTAAVELLLDCDDIIVDMADTIYQMTPLAYASQSGHEDIVRLLLARGPTLDSKNALGETPLSLALNAGHESIVHMIKEHGFGLGGRSSPNPLNDAFHEDDVLSRHAQILLDDVIVFFTTVTLHS